MLTACVYIIEVIKSVICLFVHFCFFFFKQKTAYEMRISDWSSDVCSSDLDASMRAVSDAPSVSTRNAVSESLAASKMPLIRQPRISGSAGPRSEIGRAHV